MGKTKDKEYDAEEYLIKKLIKIGKYNFESPDEFPPLIFTNNNGEYYIVEGRGYQLTYTPSMIKKVIKGLEKFLENNNDQDILAANLARATDFFDEWLGRKDHCHPEKEPVIGMIYAVRCGNKIKLGRTLDLDARLRAYKRTCADVELLGTERVYDYVMHEKVFLAEFGEPAVGAEWFNYSKEMEQKVKDYLKNVEPVLC